MQHVLVLLKHEVVGQQCLVIQPRTVSCCLPSASRTPTCTAHSQQHQTAVTPQAGSHPSCRDTPAAGAGPAGGCHLLLCLLLRRQLLAPLELTAAGV